MDFATLLQYAGTFIAGASAAAGGMKYVPPIMKKKATKKRRSVAAKKRYAKAKATSPTSTDSAA